MHSVPSQSFSNKLNQISSRKACCEAPLDVKNRPVVYDGFGVFLHYSVLHVLKGWGLGLADYLFFLAFGLSDYEYHS